MWKPWISSGFPTWIQAEHRPGDVSAPRIAAFCMKSNKKTPISLQNWDILRFCAHPIPAPKSLLQVPKQLGPGSHAGATRAPTSLTTAQFSRGPQGPATDLPNWINVASGFCFLPISGPGCHMALARMLLRHQMRSAAQPSPSL